MIWMHHDMEDETIITAQKPGKFIANFGSQSFSHEESEVHCQLAIRSVNAFAALAEHLGCKPEDLNVDLVALVRALKGIVLVCGPTGNSFEDFEIQARDFFLETGKMRPGKDSPEPELSGSHDDYRAWVQKYVNNARQALSTLPHDTVDRADIGHKE